MSWLLLLGCGGFLGLVCTVGEVMVVVVVALVGGGGGGGGDGDIAVGFVEGTVAVT